MLRETTTEDRLVYEVRSLKEAVETYKSLFRDIQHNHIGRRHFRELELRKVLDNPPQGETPVKEYPKSSAKEAHKGKVVSGSIAKGMLKGSSRGILKHKRKVRKMTEKSMQQD